MKTAVAAGSVPGSIERRVPLEGTLGQSSSKASALELGLSEAGVWLLDAAPDASLRLPLHDARYTPHAVRADRLEVAGVTLSVPLLRKREARELFALGRIRQAAGPLPPADFAGRHTDVGSLVAQAVARAWLLPGELLLAALQTESKARLEAHLTGPVEAPQVFVASDRRLALLCIGELGDWSEDHLSPGVLELTSDRGRLVRCGTVSWRPNGNAELFEELARACALSGSERTLEVSRLEHVQGSNAQRSKIEPMLARLAQEGNATALMIGRLLELERDPSAACVDALRSLEPSALERLTQTWVEWRLSQALAEQLVLSLAELGHARTYALSLRGALWQRQQGGKQSESGRLATDLAYARTARQLGADSVATEVLEARRLAISRVPVGALKGVTPEQRIELLQALYGAAPEASSSRYEAALELTQLDPLTTDRFARLVGSSTGPVAERARECQSVLDAEVLAPRAAPHLEPAPEAAQPIGELLLETRLRHPLVRGGAPLSRLIARAIASSESPNAEMLREVCERLEGSASAASRALADSAQALGVKQVAAYVSRGERDIGVRAFEAKPPFVLVGGKHLDQGSPYHLSQDELRFALGAELAHLRFGHTRFRSADLWLGALDKSRRGAELLIGVLPLLPSWNLAGHVLSGAGSLEHPLLKRVWGAAGLLQGPVSQSLLDKLRARSPLGADLTAANEELLVAHRLMQLSADRAGLVIAGSLQAAVRAILLTRADYGALRHPDPHLSLRAALEQEVSAGSSVFTDLSVRIGALLAFYVSEDYATLRAAYQAATVEPR